MKIGFSQTDDQVKIIEAAFVTLDENIYVKLNIILWFSETPQCYASQVEIEHLKMFEKKFIRPPFCLVRSDRLSDLKLICQVKLWHLSQIKILSH